MFVSRFLLALWMMWRFGAHVMSSLVLNKYLMWWFLLGMSVLDGLDWERLIWSDTSKANIQRSSIDLGMAAATGYKLLGGFWLIQSFSGLWCHLTHTSFNNWLKPFTMLVHISWDVPDPQEWPSLVQEINLLVCSSFQHRLVSLPSNWKWNLTIATIKENDCTQISNLDFWLMISYEFNCTTAIWRSLTFMDQRNQQLKT